jgi:hypothetical protein
MQQREQILLRQPNGNGLLQFNAKSTYDECPVMEICGCHNTGVSRSATEIKIVLGVSTRVHTMGIAVYSAKTSPTNRKLFRVDTKLGAVKNKNRRNL